MDPDIGKVCNNIVRLISQKGTDKAREYCKERIETDVEPKTQEYQDIKSSAIDETEVWGSESAEWLKIVPAAASEEETESEWRFVAGNLLISAVMECETSGSLTDDALIAKAANRMFRQLHKSDRHQMLSLSIYHHKMGHVMVVKENDYEAAIEHFEKAVDIIEDHKSLGNWHHHALILRDSTKKKVEHLEKQGDLLQAVEIVEENARKVNDMNAPTSDKFYNQLKAEEHRVRAKMAEKIGKPQRQRKHLRKCSRKYSEGGKEDLADQYGRKEMQVQD